MDIENIILALTSAVIGSVISGVLTGCFTLKAVKESYINQKKENNEIEERHIQGVLQAIHDEIETIFERYQETMGAHVETLQEGTPLAIYYPLTSDFFSVYNQNTFFIGKIKNVDLRRSIVRTYTLAKGMVDTFRMNNDLVHKYEASGILFEETQLDTHHNQVLAREKCLILYASQIKSSHVMRWS